MGRKLRKRLTANNGWIPGGLQEVNEPTSGGWGASQEVYEPISGVLEALQEVDTLIRGWWVEGQERGSQ